jgi:hypothetical protein
MKGQCNVSVCSPYAVVARIQLFYIAWNITAVHFLLACMQACIHEIWTRMLYLRLDRDWVWIQEATKVLLFNVSHQSMIASQTGLRRMTPVKRALVSWADWLTGTWLSVIQERNQKEISRYSTWDKRKCVWIYIRKSQEGDVQSYEQSLWQCTEWFMGSDWYRYLQNWQRGWTCWAGWRFERWVNFD